MCWGEPAQGRVRGLGYEGTSEMPKHPHLKPWGVTLTPGWGQLTPTMFNICLCSHSTSVELFFLSLIISVKWVYRWQIST